MRLLNLLLAAFAVGCAATSEEAAEGQDEHLQLAQTIRLGAYFVDGTNNHPQQNAIIHQLSLRTDRALVTSAQYFDGPDLVGLECETITERVATQICDDIHADRINNFVVFGYSRGAFIANKAAQLALSRCGRTLPVNARNVSSQYLYGGFADAVEMSPYLDDANWIPVNTRYHHVHRKDTQSWSFEPVTNFGGGIGQNDVGPDVDHISMGFSAEVLQRIVSESQTRTGLHIFSAH